MTFVRYLLISAGMVFTVMLLVGLAKPNQIPSTQLIVSEYQQDLVRWEATHFLDKWVHLALTMVSPGTASREENLQDVSAYFGMSAVASDLESSVERKVAKGVNPETEAAELSAIRLAQSMIQPVVEETLEGAISETLSVLQIPGQLGPLRWPPVDFTFEEGALVLVTSPRNEIKRLDQIVMNPRIGIRDQAHLENEIETSSPDRTAVVVRIGGLATYPAQVRSSASLLTVLEIAAHEWLHHWLIFRPLGRAWFDGGELMAINETAATMFGKEVGHRTLEYLVGTPDSAIKPPRRDRSTVRIQEPSFNFVSQMRATRTRLDTLLSRGSIQEAEVYLESRRLQFVAHGYPIRKLNTAWFAFHGSYADGGATASPIADQLQHVRDQAGSLGAFLQEISSINREGELARIALQKGWAPKSE